MPPTSTPPPSPGGGGGGGAGNEMMRLLYGVASAAAAAYASPPRAREQQEQRGQQQQPSPPSPSSPPPRAPSPPPPFSSSSASPPSSSSSLSSTSAALLAALYDSMLRLALRLSGLSDAVWTRATAGGGPAATATTTTTAPRLALAVNGALARAARSAQVALGVPCLKPSLREIATYVRAVELEAAAAAAFRSSPSDLRRGPQLLAREEADAALALCARHSLPAFWRAFWRRYAVAAATGAISVGLARDVFLPLLLALPRLGLIPWPLAPLLLGPLAALARPVLVLPFVFGPVLGAAAACGSQVHGDPLWALKGIASWAAARAGGVAAAAATADGAAAASSSSSFAAAADADADAGGSGDLGGGWTDGGADVDMVDELLAEASSYLDALNRRSAGAGAGAGAGEAPAAVAADLGARVLRALRHRRAGGSCSAAAGEG